MDVSHFVVACLFLGSATAAEWGYFGGKAPESWKDSYPNCAKDSQSPITFYEGDAALDNAIPAFTFSSYDAPVTGILKNNGHSAVVEFSPMVKLSITGGGLTGSYEAAQFHFHWGADSNKGSEHLINNQAYPMELHIVHFNTKYADLTTAVPKADGLAVLGFMFEVSNSDNAAYSDIVAGLANIANKDDSKTLTSFTMVSLLPAIKKDFFRYSGSLTTPTCDESVTWTVFKETIKISEKQLAEFRKILDSDKTAMVDNFRPVQPINAREIKSNFDTDIKWGYTTHVKAADWKDYYGSCGGKQQSPIDINPVVASIDTFGMSIEGLTFTGYDTTPDANWNIENNGHTVVLSWNANTFKIAKGGLSESYVAGQLHFHWGNDASMGSEHTVNQKAYPMEMHIVHYKESLGSIGNAAKQPEGLAVLGFFFEESSTDNPNYASIVSELSKITNAKDKTTMSSPTLDSLIPVPDKREHFYRYSGSLTTPGCFESVVWTVFGEKIQMSAAQLQAFRALISSEKDKVTSNYLPLVNNFRPVQALHTRKVHVHVPKWDYDTKLGVSDWSKYYPICSDAEKESKQSPINLDPFKVNLNPALREFKLTGFDQNVDMTMENDGHTVVVKFDNTGMTTAEGDLPGTFVPAQFHFHWGSDSSKGSEHFIDNKQYPMELHIVHYNNKYTFTEAVTKPDGLAVLGFMFEISETTNSAFEPFVSKLVDIKDPKTKVVITAKNVQSLLPARMAEYFRYSGSLTTPGCYESVTWTVFRNTIKISEAQMDKFRALKSSEKTNANTYKALVNNYRPLQKVQARKVYSNFLIGAGVSTSFSVLTMTLCSLFALLHRFF